MTPFRRAPLLIACCFWLHFVAGNAADLDGPPFIKSVAPIPGVVNELRSVTVTFSEPVQGVSPDDLLVNNRPAESVDGTGDTYIFTFTQPTYGTVDITWEAGHGIIDLSGPPLPFDSIAPGANWTYELADAIPPAVASVVPPAGAIVAGLTEIQVRFNEPVSGLDSTDLLLNGMPARALEVRSPEAYIFRFDQPPIGPVTVEWIPNHNIFDLANSANVFTGGSWSYTLEPSHPSSQVVINEFLSGAESVDGLQDEDGELQDWIEVHNRGDTPADLAGWSLTDDPDEPDLWPLPNITLAPKEFLVIFASGKDRRLTGPGRALHTNFRLSSVGEYLALYDANSPRRAATEFPGDYPEQRNDFSYGWDGATWRYYREHTPGMPNGASPIAGVVPKPTVSVNRGFFDGPFALTLTSAMPGTSIRYTLNGAVATPNSGTLYTGPLEISRSTILRAVAFQGNYLPSEVITHSYIFIDQVLRQPNNPPGFPTGASVMSGFPSDYEMDPEIVNHPAYSAQMKAALRALPTLSIVMKVDDMFGADNGIYTHPFNRGPAWERPCSIEFLPLDGNDFQANAGIQIQGNAARDPIKQPKHPLRVVFKADYGPKNLDEKIFPDSPIDSFDTLILRADFNYSWLHWNPTQRIRAQRIRDSWMKDSMRAMGGLASHNRYLHLYINGLYWGIYDASERPDGSFGAAYLGGQKEEYDVVNEGERVDGTMQAYNTLLGFRNLGSLSQYNAIKQYLDMPQFIDYMLLHFFVGHEDWGNNKNWYTLRPRDGSKGFLYVPWDGEMILGNVDVNRVRSSDVPSGLHTRLIDSAQYRLDFADRAHRHLFNDGALTPQQNINRWENRARDIELPIIAESARWGDYRRDVHSYQDPPYELYTRENQWRNERARLVNNYFPARTGILLNQLRSAGLYPSIAAASFSQHGGRIDPGFELRMTVPAGTIYYTTNGIDPRVYGSGQVSPAAVRYSGPVPLGGGTVVKARVRSGEDWSALTEAVFTLGRFRTPLRITEIMYHPEPSVDAYEFLELENVGALPFNAGGLSLEGVDYIFPPGSILQPGQIIVLGSAENGSVFQERYPNVAVFGRFNGQLLNRGERLALVSPTGETLYSVDYSDGNGWPAAADGDGASLEINDPLGDPDNPANWHASGAVNGTPGRANSAPAAPAVRINEILASSDGADWVELVNRTSASIDLGGWALREPGNSNRFVFPIETTLSPNAYIVVLCDKGSGPGLHAPFALDAESETIVLEDSSGRRVDVLEIGPQVRGYSTGWIEQTLELNLPTPGQPNAAASIGSPAQLRINEWFASSGSGQSDWVELHNANVEEPVSLRGLFIGFTNRPFEISAHAFVAPGGYVVLYADENPGPDHVDFKLPAEGTTIALFDSGERIIDSVTFGAQSAGVSQGFYPEGTANIAKFPVSPTPGAKNSLSFPISCSMQGARFVVAWPSAIGTTYRVERSDDLLVWTRFAEITASARSTSADDATDSTSRYYRVIAQ